MTREPPPRAVPPEPAGGQDEGYAVRWHLVLPVKDATLAKSRLAPPVPLARPALAHAVARDTLEAVCTALPPDQVVVVTDGPVADGDPAIADGAIAALAHRLGALVVPDPGGGLDAAVLAGLHALPAGRIGRAVLLGDLPSLRPEDLTTALAACAAYPQAVVPDAEGTGTVLLTSTRGLPRPRFGAGSAARHARDAELLDLDLPRLRRDVDTWEDLEVAAELGVGPHTRAALARPGGRA